MSDRSKIEWTDATYNPVTGCTQVSPGCDHCYARTMAERFRGTPGHYFEHWFDVQLRPAKLEEPLHWRRPRRVFVCSMSDLFHDDVPDSYIAKVWAVMALTPQHTYQVLTKRHGRMRSLLSSPAFEDQVRAVAGVEFGLDYHGAWPLPNVWLGVSVEDQSCADLRIPALMETPAAVRFISCEPLLGPVTLTHLHSHCPTHDFAGGFCSGPCPDRRWPDWVIVGGESGRGARPMWPDWARSLRDQCTEAGVPYFFKQWGEWAPWPHVHARPDGWREWRHEGGGVARVGKKAAGRELDGRTWDEYPEVRP